MFRRGWVLLASFVLLMAFGSATGDRPSLRAEGQAGLPEAEVRGLRWEWSGEDLLITWVTTEITSYQAFVRWIDGAGTSISDPVVVDSSESGTVHSLTLACPGPAVGVEVYLGPHASPHFFETVYLLIPATPAAVTGESGSLSSLRTPEFEPNGTAADANRVEFGCLITGAHDYIGDEDWYMVEVPARTVVGIRFDRPFTSLKVDTMIEWYEASDIPGEPRLIWSGGVIGGGDFSTSDSVYGAATCFLRLLETTDLYVGSYEIVLTAAPVLDEGDPDSLDDPRLLTPDGRPNTWYDQNEGDQDYFGLDVPPALVGRIIALDVRGNPSADGVGVSLMPPDSDRYIYSLAMVLERFQAGFPAAWPGLYRICVGSRGDSGSVRTQRQAYGSHRLVLG